MTKQASKEYVPALVKALDIIDYVGKHPASTFTSIHTELGLPKSSVYLLIKTLVAQGILRMTADNSYVLGLRLFELGALAVKRLDIRNEAKPLMADLANRIQATCHLGIIDGVEAVYLAKVEGDQAIVVNSWEGKRVSLHSSALGKSLLLSLPTKQLHQIMTSFCYTPHTPKSIKSKEELMEQLELCRTKGWTIDDEEDILGIRCIAVPIPHLLDQPLALSVSGTTEQIPLQRCEEFASMIRTTAEQLAVRLGARGTNL